MSTLSLIFDVCTPRADVKAGIVRSHLVQVVDQAGMPAYLVPSAFFAHSHPTRGMKDLLRTVCLRLSGTGGMPSTIRLHTLHGGGKTHCLISLVHAVRGMQGVANVSEFIDPALLPTGPVRIAALDAESSDPADGLPLQGDLRAYTLWGEMAYQLAGAEGYRRIEESDRRRVPPDAETLRALIGDQPTLVMLDEIALYLPKAERAHPGGSGQVRAFLRALFQAVESSPRAALVVTLAVDKDLRVAETHREEHERAVATIAEAESVAARNAQHLTPAEEDETADVIRRRLFEQVDAAKAEAVVNAYWDVWDANAHAMPRAALTAEMKQQFILAYPLHPETLSLLTEKTDSLGDFHRTRGMLRLLAETVHILWRDRPADAYAIHPHHIDLSFAPIRDEITVRLGQVEFTPALTCDVAAVPPDGPSVAQLLDVKYYAGQLPIASYIARTVFLNTLARRESAKGIDPDRLKFSVCSPGVGPGFVEQACSRFIADSLYLDDRPGAPMRLLVEPNLERIICKQMAEIDAGAVRQELENHVRGLFGGPAEQFHLVPFPTGGCDLPGDLGDGRPLLVIMNCETVTISAEIGKVPTEIEEMCKRRNGLVCLVADQWLRENMRQKAYRCLALDALLKPDRICRLAEHQQREVRQQYEELPLELAAAILDCYRHLFHLPPGSMSAGDPIAHRVINVDDAKGPGGGQIAIVRALAEKGPRSGDCGQGDAPGCAPAQKTTNGLDPPDPATKERSCWGP
jgi:hypothetical protein